MEEKIQTQDQSESSWKELFKFGVIVLAIVIPFRIFIAQPYIVEGSSMDPTFKNGDYLIVDQISYRFENPKREDVIILKYPKDTSKFFIKRVIGLPGEIVKIRGGKVYIDQKDGSPEIALEGNYITYPKIEDGEYKLGEKEYFVMGDNRAGSSDSRYWGTLPQEDVVGRPILRLMPLNKLGLLPGKVN